ncbi:MAG: ATP phosphoribosyltransferase [Coriobacteriales bacterium]|jgi:ATP phosphoribosyltransferase
MALTTPRGMRDVLPEEALWRERITANVTRRFSEKGYLPVETPILEPRDLIDPVDMPADDAFRLFDRDGAQLMLRPDVTLPIARMVSARLGDNPGPWRLRYVAPVFCETDALRGEPRQFTQLGIELIGLEGVQADAEVLSLADGALQAAGLADYVIAVGSVRPVLALLDASGMPEAWRSRVLAALRANDLVAYAELVDSADELSAEARAALKGVVSLHGGREVIGSARRLTGACGCTGEQTGLDELEQVIDAATISGTLVVDFSLTGSFGYYSGMVFAAYAPGMGSPLGSGGRYDHVFERYGNPRAAAGFALSLDALQTALDRPHDSRHHPLRVAVSKGALFPETLDLLRGAGYAVDDLAEPGRQLTITCEADDVEYIIVRPTDAPAFVAFGGADVGICGRDSLFEADMDVLELIDLRFGACRFVVAEPAGSGRRVEENYRRLGAIRVATKYPRITRSYYQRIGVTADVLKLHGNIELAPLVGMADRIVDITATGTTLRENNLVVVDDVMHCTARLFANVCSARTDPRVHALSERLRVAVEARRQAG